MKTKPKLLPKFWNSRELSYFYSFIRRDRDRLMMYLMASCGLRVSELCSLRLDNISWDERSIRVVGKGEKERFIPMNDQVYDLLVSYLEKRPASANGYVVSSLKGSSGPLSRRTVHSHVSRYAKNAGLSHGHPHTLRHSFGTGLAAKGVPIERIAELMGHEDINTTRVYVRISAQHKKKAVERLDTRPWIIRFMSRLFNKPVPAKVFSQPSLRVNSHTAGRHRELARLQHNLAKGVDTILTGGPGVGKTHLLDQLEAENLIRLQHFTPVKQAIQSVAEHLYTHGVLAHGCEKAATWEDIKKAHIRTTVRQWGTIILDSVAFNEWVLVVHDLTDITKSSVRILNQLNRKFIIIAAMRQLKPSMVHDFWKYDKVDIEPLTRYESILLIRHLCRDANIEDYPLFETHVLKRSGGNPRAIIEIVERARKEPVITRHFTRNISHPGALKKVDLSPVFVLIAAALVASRFVARGTGDTDFYIFSGVGGALFMLMRFFAGRSRR